MHHDLALAVVAGRCRLQHPRTGQLLQRSQVLLLRLDRPVVRRREPVPVQGALFEHPVLGGAQDAARRPEPRDLTGGLGGVRIDVLELVGQHV